MREEFVVCPDCQGQKQVIGFLDGFRDGKRFGIMRHHACYTCKGSGQIDAAQATRRAIGRKVRNARVDRDETQRESATAVGLTEYEYSKCEHGTPPTIEAWEKFYALYEDLA